MICPPDIDAPLSPDKKDLPLLSEDEITAYLSDNGIKTVVADPLYRYILPEGCKLIELPHFAFSGRCFARDMRDIINNVNKEFFE